MEGRQEFSAFIRDITERRKREEELRLAATVFETVDEAVIITDTENRIITVNSAFTSITGYSREEVVGKNPHVLSSGKHPPEFYQELWGTLTATGSWHGEVWNRRKLGDIYVEQLSIHTVRDAQGQLTHHVGKFSDISERKAAEEHVRHMAHYDLLTDLPNRALITDRLRQTLAQAKRARSRMALMFLDLDRFKPVNDTFGHAVGDMLLKEVANRLQQCMRESDTVARIGGDEFVVLLPSIDDEKDALVVAGKILDALSQPFEIDAHRLYISSSIGIAIYPDHGEDEDLLVRNADIAMYHAKVGGRNNAQTYHSEMPQNS
jgi:diguanylate cyclase (GGDEF)-like protein/PAS domain S-box-containing protein